MLPITQSWPATCFNSTLLCFSPNIRSISESPIRWIPTSNRTRPARHRKVLSIIIMRVFLSLFSTHSLSAICGLPCTGCSCSGSCKTSSRHGRARRDAEPMGAVCALLYPLLSPIVNHPKLTFCVIETPLIQFWYSINVRRDIFGTFGTDLTIGI